MKISCMYTLKKRNTSHKFDEGRKSCYQFDELDDCSLSVLWTAGKEAVFRVRK
jgi:hypothetical protein